MTDLADRRCAACDGNTKPLTGEDITARIAHLSEAWSTDNETRIIGRFEFKNYYETQAFINAVAYIAHREDHHPDVTFGYNSAEISFTTHAIEGLSENDFICAAKIDRLSE